MEARALNNTTHGSDKSDRELSPTRALAALVFFGAIAPAMLLVAPSVGSQLFKQFGLSASQIGTFFFIELGAFSVAGIPSLFLIRRVDFRFLTRVAIAVFVGGNIATALLTPTFHLLLALRAATALAGGTLMVIVNIGSASTPSRQRTYGLVICGQLVLGAIGLAALPALFATFGIRALFWTFAALMLAAAPLTTYLPRSPRMYDAPSIDTAEGVSVIHRPKPAIDQLYQRLCGSLTVASIFAFYFAVGSVWTFINRDAQATGLSEQMAGTILSIATVMGIAGAGTASLFSTRWSGSKTLTIGYVLLIASLSILSMDHQSIGFGVAVFMFKFAWTFTLPFILSTASRTDGADRLFSLIQISCGAALATGPMITGVLLDGGWGLASIFKASAILSIVSYTAILVVERKRIR